MPLALSWENSLCYQSTSSFNLFNPYVQKNWFWRRGTQKKHKKQTHLNLLLFSLLVCFFHGSVLLYLHLKILLHLLRLLLRSSSCELPHAEILRTAKGRLAAFAAIFAFQTERAHMLPGHQKPRVIFFCPEVFLKFPGIFLFGCFGEVVVFQFWFECWRKWWLFQIFCLEFC